MCRTLRKGSHVIGVTTAGRQLTVTVDGKKVLADMLPAGAMPPTANVAFTGATGSHTDNQNISRVTIAAGRRTRCRSRAAAGHTTTRRACPARTRC